jgi:hypothetical protein
VEALHATLLYRLEALSISGVDRGTTIIHRCEPSHKSVFGNHNAADRGSDAPTAAAPGA